VKKDIIVLSILVLFGTRGPMYSSQAELPGGWPAHMTYISGQYAKPVSMVIEHINDAVGKGAVLLVDVKKDQVVAEYTGRRKVMFHTDTVSLVYGLSIAKYDPETHAFNFKDTDGSYQMLVDAEKCGNASRFFNHSSNRPNVAFTKYLLTDPKVVFVRALKDIQAGTEIKVNYGDGYWKDKGRAPLEY